MRDLLWQRETARRVLSLRTALSALVSPMSEHTFRRKDRIPEVPSDLSFADSSSWLTPSALPHNHSSLPLFISIRRAEKFFSLWLLVSLSNRALCQKNCGISPERRACKLGSECFILQCIECSDSEWRKWIETNVRVTMKRDFVPRGSFRWPHDYPKIVERIFFTGRTESRNF